MKFDMPFGLSEIYSEVEKGYNVGACAPKYYKMDFYEYQKRIGLKIEESRSILELTYNYDGNGSKSIKEETYNKMCSFLNFFIFTLQQNNIQLSLLFTIGTGPKESIDLYWKNVHLDYTMLINIQEGNDKISYYADLPEIGTYDLHYVKGEFSNNERAPKELIEFLRKI